MILSDDQRAIQESAQRFSRERLLPEYQRREALGVLDRRLIAEMGELGFLGMDLPEKFGGMGTNAVTVGLVAEALAYGDFNISAVQVGLALNGGILVRNASAEIVEEWAPRIASGSALIGICLTEPRGGSDASNLQMRARREGHEYVVAGEKASITLADRADAYLIFARTGAAEDGAKGVSAFFVPGDLPGISTSKYDDVGSSITGRGSVFFDDVRLPERFRLGEEGKGITQVLHGFDYSRALIALQCCGSAQASLDESWTYVAEREAFGRPIGQFQGVSFPLAEGESKIAAVRQLSYHTLALRDAGLPHTAEAAMCKWMGPRYAFDTIHDCLLTFGHYGWSKDLAHQQRLRDVMGLEIGDGTAGVMKQVIARTRIGRAAIQY